MTQGETTEPERHGGRERVSETTGEREKRECANPGKHDVLRINTNSERRGVHTEETHTKKKKTHSDAGVAGTHLDPANRADDPEHTRETRITSSSTSPLELGQLGAETLGDWRCKSERLEAHLGRWYGGVPTKLDLPPTAHTQ